MMGWEDIFKDVLKEERIPLPEGDWEEMEELLNNHIRHKTARRILIIVTPVLAALSVFLLLETNNHIKPEEVVSHSQTKETTIKTVSPNAFSEIIINEIVEKRQVKEGESVTDTVAISVQEEIDTVNSENDKQIQQRTVADSEDNHTGKKDIIDRFERIEETASATKYNRFIIGLKSTTFSTTSTSAGVSTMIGFPWDTPHSVLASDIPYPVDYKHSYPRTIGVAISYSLSDKTMVSSGIDLSYCNSKVTFSDGSETNQKTNYAGIPLRLDWMPIQTKNVFFYTGAGVEAWRCLYSSQGNEKQKDNNMYYSAIGLVGIRYEPVSNLGLFLEPQYSYNFLNKNPAIRSAITDTRNIFSVKAGISLSFR